MILPGSDIRSIDLALERIRAGGLVGLPTETVYGLAADADCDAAVAQIFAAKGRPTDHPLIVHVANSSLVAHYALQVPAFAQSLMQAFWPGPLTIILPRRAGVANASAAACPTVALRCPDHPVALALLRAGVGSGVCGLAAPSANQFGRVSPTTPAHVQAEFGAALLILDGGACRVGIESTIIDCSRSQPVLLRPGVITPAVIWRRCGVKLRAKNEQSDLAQAAPKASGTLASHYAPRANLRLMSANVLRQAWTELLAEVVAPAKRVAIWSRLALDVTASQHLWQAMPSDADLAAQQLFAVLRQFDAQGAQQIWVQTPPAATRWDGVRDRLQRAAQSKSCT